MADSGLYPSLKGYVERLIADYKSVNYNRNKLLLLYGLDDYYFWGIWAD